MFLNSRDTMCYGHSEFDHRVNVVTGMGKAGNHFVRYFWAVTVLISAVAFLDF